MQETIGTVALLNTALGISVAVTVFFLKRTAAQLDKVDERLQRTREEFGERLTALEAGSPFRPRRRRGEQPTEE